MLDRRLARAFIVLYVTTGLGVLAQSVQTVIVALGRDLPGGDRPHALLLGSLEIAAAALFLIPRSMRRGAAGLLGVFAVAFVLHALRGEVAWSLLIYSAAVVFVRTHGVGPRRATRASA